MARTLLDLDDEALACAAALLGTTTKVETVNRALRLVAGSAPDDEPHEWILPRGTGHGGTGNG